MFPCRNLEVNEHTRVFKTSLWILLYILYKKCQRVVSAVQNHDVIVQLGFTEFQLTVRLSGHKFTVLGRFQS